MRRTAEQIAADDALRAAIDGVVQAYELIPESPTPFLLTEYVVIMCHQSFDEQGHGSTRYGWTMQDEGMPWHHVFGLVDMGRKRMETDMENLQRGEDD